MARLTKKQQQRADEAEQEILKNRESEEIEDSDAPLEGATAAKEDKGKAKGTRKKTTLQKRNRKDVSEESTADSEVSSSSSIFNPRPKKAKSAKKNLGVPRSSTIPNDRKEPALKLKNKGKPLDGTITLDHMHGGKHIFGWVWAGIKYVGEYGGAE